MKNVHMTLQGKGGVGKSYVASLLAQYHNQQGWPVECIDTDPVNATFCGYKSLNVQYLQLLAEDKTIDQRRFDTLMERVLTEDTNFVIDNGSSSFLPLTRYLVENDAVDMIKSAGKQVVVHTVVTGGQAMNETLRGLKELGDQLADKALLIVWLNEYFGDVTGRDKKGEIKEFEEMKVYQAIKKNITGMVRLRRQSSATFGKDVELMLDENMTFDDVQDHPSFGIMAKQRLAMVRKQIVTELDAVMGTGE